MSVLGVQGQPERVLKECGIVGGLVRELQRATVVRECGKERDKMHEKAQYSKGVGGVVVEGGRFVSRHP
jgi:hypothetical protein